MQRKEPIIGLRFTLEQIAVLVKSTEGNDWGFHIVDDRKSPQMPEVAEVWLHDPTLPLFFMTPLSGGDIEVYDVVHEIYNTRPIQEVLASIVMVETVAT